MKNYFIAAGFILLIPSVMATEETAREDALGIALPHSESATSPASLIPLSGSPPSISAALVASPAPSESPLPTSTPILAALAVSPAPVAIPVPARALPASIDSRSEITKLTSDPSNFENKGGFAFGILSEKALKLDAVEAQLSIVSGHYNDLRVYNAALLRQLEIANGGLKDVDAIRRALKETQEKFDREKAEKDALADKLRAVEARANYLKDEEEKLLLEADRKDAAMALEKARKEFLEKENLRLRKIIAELEANAKIVTSLLVENNDYERTLQDLRGDDPVELEKTRQSIRKIVDENAKKIRELQETNKALALKEQETREKIKKLEKAIEANDYYTLILKKIKDRDVSDDELSLFIWSIRTVQGADLDQLSEGRGVRLIEALIDVSRPYDSRPSRGQITFEFTDAHFRKLGNLFTPRGLAWIGVPLNLADCRHQGSQFERNSASVARLAKAQLGKQQ